MPKSNKNYPSLLNTLGFSTSVNKKDANKTGTSKSDSSKSDSSKSDSENTKSETEKITVEKSENITILSKNKKTDNKSDNSEEEYEESSISPTLIEELKSVHNSDLDTVTTKSMVTSKLKKHKIPTNDGSYDTEDLLKSEFIDKESRRVNNTDFLDDNKVYTIVNKMIDLLNNKKRLDQTDEKILKYCILLKDNLDIESEININNLSLAEEDIGFTQTQLSPISETNISIAPSFGGSYSKKQKSNLSKQRIIIPKHRI